MQADALMLALPSELILHSETILSSLVLHATQGPVRGANFAQPVTVAAWTSKPSWYIVAAKDRMIDPDAQRALA